jgi:hexosaminidase
MFFSKICYLHHLVTKPIKFYRMYKKIFISLCVFMPLFTGLVNAQDNDPNMGIIPAPVSLKKTAGEFVLSRETTLLADSVTNKAVVFLRDYLLNKA